MNEAKNQEGHPPQNQIISYLQESGLLTQFFKKVKEKVGKKGLYCREQKMNNCPYLVNEQ